MDCAAFLRRQLEAIQSRVNRDELGIIRSFLEPQWLTEAPPRHRLPTHFFVQRGWLKNGEIKWNKSYTEEILTYEDSCLPIFTIRGRTAHGIASQFGALRENQVCWRAYGWNLLVAEEVKPGIYAPLEYLQRTKRGKLFYRIAYAYVREEE